MEAIERELATMRGLASCAGDDAKIDEAEAELAEMRAEIERLRAAIAWALGESPDCAGKWFEPDDDEPRRPDGQPVARYWWRVNLRRLTTPNIKHKGPPVGGPA